MINNIYDHNIDMQSIINYYIIIIWYNLHLIIKTKSIHKKSNIQHNISIVSLRI